MVKNRRERDGAAFGVALPSRNLPDRVAEKENAAREQTGPLIEMVEAEPVPETVGPCGVRSVAQRIQKILVERGENRTVFALWPEEGFLKNHRQVTTCRASRIWIPHDLLTQCEDLVLIAACAPCNVGHWHCSNEIGVQVRSLKCSQRKCRPKGLGAHRWVIRIHSMIVVRGRRFAKYMVVEVGVVGRIPFVKRCWSA